MSKTWLEKIKHEGFDPVHLLDEMMAIDSPTDNHAGVQSVLELLAHRLERIGFEIHWKQNPRGSHVSPPLLEARLYPQTQPQDHSTPTKWITLVSHADTVLGLREFGPLQILADGHTGHGAGAIDNKGGLVVALTGLELLHRRHALDRRFGLRFICSPNEEQGSVGFTDYFRELADDSVMALGFEPSLENGSIISSRRGNRWYQIEITGLPAHAGRSKGEHVNAAHEAAFQIAKLHKLNDHKRQVAVNVGHILAGHDRFNITCGFAQVKLDTRFASFEDRDRLHRKIEKVLGSNFVSSVDKKSVCQVNYAICDDCPPFSSSRRSRRIVQGYVDRINRLEDASIRHEMAGGAGDVNYMSSPHNIVIDGLGPVGGAMHTAQEYIQLPSLATRAVALSEFLADCLKPGKGPLDHL